MRFYVLVFFSTDQLYNCRRIRLLSVFVLFLNSPRYLNFFIIQWWSSWLGVWFQVNWVNIMWDSTSTELTCGETRLLNQPGAMKFCKYWWILRWLTWHGALLSIDLLTWRLTQHWLQGWGVSLRVDYSMCGRWNKLTQTYIAIHI